MAAVTEVPTCSVPRCEGTLTGRRTAGLCRAHFDRLQRHGDVRADIPVRRKGSPPPACILPDCSAPSNCRRMCRPHYNEWRTSGGCSIADCARRIHNGGLCSSHYKRKQTYGDPLAGPPIREPRGGRHVNGDGYVLIYKPNHPNAGGNGYVREHTLVMSRVLSRPLLPGESVHHLNGVRDDNRPENLELWVTTQPSGQRVPDLIQHALAILNRYGDDPLAYGEVTA